MVVDSSGYPLTVTVVLFLTSTSILTWCFSTLPEPRDFFFTADAVRSDWLERWRSLSYSRWLVLFIYVDSYFFVASTSILQVGVGLTNNPATCQAAIFMCIFFYFFTKVAIYLFLIERVHIVRGSALGRLKDKLYLFNMCGLIPYVVIGLLAIIFRVDHIDDSGKCMIGVQRQTAMLVIIYDLVINVYLTISFLIPILGLYSFRNNINTRLKVVAKRTFIGTICTLLSSIANITAIFVLEGYEPAFVCLTCCTLDVSFSAIVIHWVTSVHMDDTPALPTIPTQCAFHHRNSTICCMNPNLKATVKQPSPHQGFVSPIPGKQAEVPAKETGIPARALKILGKTVERKSNGEVKNKENGNLANVRSSVYHEQGEGHEMKEGITVRVDVWRTVEVAKNEEDE